MNYFFEIINGVGITLSLMLLALAMGGSLAFLMVLADISKRVYLKAPIKVFLFFIRGTPLLVQFFLIYFGLGQFDWLRESFLWTALQQPFVCAVIALSLNSSAYTTVLLKGAIDSVPKTEMMACKALGMSRALAFKRIIFPHALRLVLPAYSNEVMIVLKGTSLASTITLLDLMGVTNQIIGKTYETIPFLCLAGAIYLMLNVIIMGIFKYIECRVGKAFYACPPN